MKTYFDYISEADSRAMMNAKKLFDNLLWDMERAIYLYIKLCPKFKANAEKQYAEFYDYYIKFMDDLLKEIGNIKISSASDSKVSNVQKSIRDLGNYLVKRFSMYDGYAYLDHKTNNADLISKDYFFNKIEQGNLPRFMLFVVIEQNFDEFYKYAKKKMEDIRRFNKGKLQER